MTSLNISVFGKRTFARELTSRMRPVFLYSTVRRFKTLVSEFVSWKVTVGWRLTEFRGSFTVWVYFSIVIETSWMSLVDFTKGNEWKRFKRSWEVLSAVVLVDDGYFSKFRTFVSIKVFVPCSLLEVIQSNFLDVVNLLLPRKVNLHGVCDLSIRVYKVFLCVKGSKSD